MINEKNVFRLGVEETCLGLVLCNEMAFGFTVLKSLEKPIPNDLVEASLDTAHRSLKARGLLKNNEQGQENLVPELATALKTLASFDSAISVTRVKGQSSQTETIHLRSMGNLVSWTTEMQVVYTLSLNPASSAKEYLRQKFKDFGESGATTESSKQKITMEMMNQIISAARENGPIDKILNSSGWEAVAAKDFKADMVGQVYRASIIWTKAGSRRIPENLETVERAALFLVKGKSRCWVLEFPEFSEKMTGEAYRVSQAEFTRVLMATIP